MKKSNEYIPFYNTRMNTNNKLFTKVMKRKTLKLWCSGVAKISKGGGAYRKFAADHLDKTIGVGKLWYYQNIVTTLTFVIEQVTTPIDNK